MGRGALALAGVDWGWSELFRFKNNGSRAACKTKSVLSFNYTRHKSLKEGGSEGEKSDRMKRGLLEWPIGNCIGTLWYICMFVVSSRLKFGEQSKEQRNK